MMEKVLLMYENGAITADHLVVEWLNMVDALLPG